MLEFLTILFCMFCVAIAVQLVYYGLVFSKFSFQKTQTPQSNFQPVSVIICAKNEAENLKAFLPAILAQDYPVFEVVLINDSSIDKTFEVMESFKALHSNIKLVNVKNIEAFWGNKKYALTLGIKAARYNQLLFTDADCMPVTKHWIHDMSSFFSETKTIVLGYGAYKKEKKSWLNKVIRFETFLTALQYFSYAKNNKPYMGVGRNLAYTKTQFFEESGFMSHMDVRSGDDDLFINQAATETNTAICIAQTSFTESMPKSTFELWIRQKRRHVSTASHYKFKHKLMLSVFYVSQLFFWILGVILVSVMFNWEIVIALIVLRWILVLAVASSAAKKLNERDLLLYYPFLELFLILTQLFIFIKNTVSKPKHWT